MRDKPHKRYRGFILAATAYVTGAFLFSVWSYTSHRSERLAFIDKSLLDTAVATREIVRPELISFASDHPIHDETLSTDIQSRLMRLVRNGRFTSIGVAHVHPNQIELMMTGWGEGDELHEESINEHLEHELANLSKGGQHEISLFTMTNLPQGSVRVAVAYDAKNEHQGTAYIVVQHSSMIKEELGVPMLGLTAAGMGLLILAIPLIPLLNRSNKVNSTNLSVMNDQLQHDMNQQKSREDELKDAIRDLERFNAVSAGRESRIIELKAEVNDLLEQLNRTKRYNIDRID